MPGTGHHHILISVQHASHRTVKSETETYLLIDDISEPVDISTNHRLQTTIDFPIHLSYKTGHFEAIYKIQKSSNTTNNHFSETLLIIFHYRKNMNMGSSPKF